MLKLNDYIIFILRCRDERTALLWEVHSPIQQSYGHEKDIVIVNEFLRRELGSLSFDTIDVRMCLVDSDYESWCQDFEEFIAPFIVKWGLPCWSNSR